MTSLISNGKIPPFGCTQMLESFWVWWSLMVAFGIFFRETPTVQIESPKVKKSLSHLTTRAHIGESESGLKANTSMSKKWNQCLSASECRIILISSVSVVRRVIWQLARKSTEFMLILSVTITAHHSQKLQRRPRSDLQWYGPSNRHSKTSSCSEAVHFELCESTSEWRWPIPCRGWALYKVASCSTFRPRPPPLGDREDLCRWPAILNQNLSLRMQRCQLSNDIASDHPAKFVHSGSTCFWTQHADLWFLKSHPLKGCGHTCQVSSLHPVPPKL